MNRLALYRDVILAVAILALALVVRFLVAGPLLFSDHGFVMGDDDDYYRLAISFIESGRLEDGFRAYRMPVFPLFLAAIYRVFGPDPINAQYVLIVVSALVCSGSYLLGKQLFNPAVGMIAGVFTAVDFGLVFYGPFLMTDTLFVFLVLSAMLSLERLRRVGSWQWAVITGGMFALATLTRINFGFFVPIALGWLGWNSGRTGHQVWRNTIIICALVGGLWLSWMARNYVELGALVPFTTQGGNAYYGVYNDLVAKKTQFSEFGYWSDLVLPAHPVAWNEVQLDRWQRELALDWIKAHPGVSIKLAGMQVIHFWRPEFDADILYRFIFPMSILGLYWALRRGNDRVMIWALMMGTFSFLAFITIGVPRFRLVFHPVMAVLASFTLVTSVHQMGQARLRLLAVLNRISSGGGV